MAGSMALGLRPLLLLILLTGFQTVRAMTAINPPTQVLEAGWCYSGNTDVFEAVSSQSRAPPTHCIGFCFRIGSTHMGLTDRSCYCGTLKNILPSGTTVDSSKCSLCSSSSEFTCGTSAVDDSLYVYTLQACSVGTFGINCDRECHCALQAGGLASACTFTGICSGNCAPGYTGSPCSDTQPPTASRTTFSESTVRTSISTSTRPTVSGDTDGGQDDDDEYDETTGGNAGSWIPAVAGVCGCVAVVTVVFVGVACYIKRRKNNSTERGQTQEVMTNRTANDQKRTRANLPDVASDDYVEIIEPDYQGTHTKGIEGAADETPANHQYEMLQPRSTKFDDWIKKNNISQTTQDKLRRQTILTIDDLKKLTDNDILELGLTIGERNRLKTALEKLKK